MEIQNEKSIKSKDFPPNFLEFLKENEIDPNIYSPEIISKIPRYFRVQSSTTISLKELQTKISPSIQPVSWFPYYNFYSVDPNVKISESSLYKEGLIFGMDISSAVSIYFLEIQEGNHCLDLCCAPGAKLCLISWLLKSKGSVTGVDISQDRLSACKNLIRKYKFQNIRLLLEDGTQFKVMAPTNSSNLPVDLEMRRLQSFQKKRKKNRPYFYLGNGIGSLKQSNDCLYDRVLVDAECTHDGSFKHVLKFDQTWGWETLDQKFLDKSRIESLTNLQGALLRNGFRLLKPGGILIYSTCSLSKKQNEEVVSHFLKEEPTAELIPLPIEIPIPEEDISNTQQINRKEEDEQDFNTLNNESSVNIKKSKNNNLNTNDSSGNNNITTNLENHEDNNNQINLNQNSNSNFSQGTHTKRSNFSFSQEINENSSNIHQRSNSSFSQEINEDSSNIHQRSNSSFSSNIHQISKKSILPIKKSKELKGALRFEPQISFTSGLFLAKLTKKN